MTGHGANGQQHLRHVGEFLIPTAFMYKGLLEVFEVDHLTCFQIPSLVLLGFGFLWQCYTIKLFHGKT